MILLKKIAVAGCAMLAVSGSFAKQVYMGSGIKTGEVTATTAVVWTRLTKAAELRADGTDPFKLKQKDTDPAVLDNVAGSMSGTAGEVKISWWPEDDTSKLLSNDWTAVDPQSDFTYQLRLKDLQPNKRYIVKAEGRNGDATQVVVDGGFRTAGAANTPQKVSFTVITGQDYQRRDDKVKGHVIYDSMLKLSPDFIINTGDVVYYDKPGPFALNPGVARMKWNMVYGSPYQRAFHNVVSSYFIKDDHDITRNDAGPGSTQGDITWAKGLKIFNEQTPAPKVPYRTIRWGKDLQIWIPEGREFRSENKAKDGPDKTIWGKEQLEWFFKSVNESDATFRVLVSPTPIVGPDRAKKNDNHANKGFSFEGDLLREFIGQQKNMYVVCGDRHWQYVSVDPQTGVREYSCGATSAKHAGGFRIKDKSPMHKYLNIKGGFLSVIVQRKSDKPTILFRHHDVKGNIYHDEFWNEK